ncbi:MAG: T9SS type A sorting domain-containing protein [Mucilaginibacter sp.]|uniref:T9SS type A sorting domain-containing protein n=1 Tax=Mucilaginibacter sp. TaxID=1882438 RepID=UPI003264E1A5
MRAIYHMASGKLSFFIILFTLVTQLCFAQTVQRLKFSGFTVSKNTGQDYSPWLSDGLDTLIQAVWSGNSVYVDITLKLATPGKITKLSLYDYQGVFLLQPAYIYALKGTKKTLLTKFFGPSYMTWENHTYDVPVDADAIIVHKYGNNIPQKVLIYGYPNITTPPVTVPVTPPVVKPDSIVKIPITASRWYQLNNVSNGLDALTDGVTDVDVNTGWGKLIDNFDAVYPVADGEKITLSKVKFFSYHGGLDKPMTLAIINSKGQRINVGVFKGFQYLTWLGPYPDRATDGDAKFNLDSTITDIKYLVVNSNSGYPTEMELYGTYKAPTPIAPMVQRPTKLKQFFGINAFEWNFENGAIDPTKIDPDQIKALKSFTQVRHYMDWEKLEADQGSYTYNPTRNGGWSYDAMYQFCKDNGIEVLADLKQLPGWMVDSYPDSLKDGENVPLKYGKDFSDPASYIEQAKTAFQYVARYGSNAQVDSTLLSVNGTQRWTGDPVNVIKKGMGLIKYIECDNERDKWWKGRKGFQTAYEYAANLSAFYDGNKNTMGPGVGVKNADASMKVVMCGLSHADPGYVRGMVDWCKQHRGYKADGSVNLCWDVINYHLYSNDANSSQNGTSTRGMAPEVDSFTGKSARDFVKMAHEVAGDMPVWVTEVGYDLNQGSPYKAIQIGNKTPIQTQADWILRSSLLYARNGVDRIFFYQMYDDNALNPIQFGSSGLINDDKTRRPAADYMYQTNKLLGEYTFKQTLNSDPIVDKYDLNGKSAYILVVPDEKGRTADYSLDLPGADSAKVYTLKIGADSMDMQYAKVINGKLQLTVTETPIFVIPVMGAVVTGQSLNALPANVDTKGLVTPTGVNKTVTQLNTLKLYPNPSVGYVSVAFNSPDVKNSVNVRIYNEQTGRIFSSFTDAKSTLDYSKLIDMSGVTMGVYVVEIKQGSNTMMKKLIRINQ